MHRFLWVPGYKKLVRYCYYMKPWRVLRVSDRQKSFENRVRAPKPSVGSVASVVNRMGPVHPEGARLAGLFLELLDYWKSTGFLANHWVTGLLPHYCGVRGMRLARLRRALGGSLPNQFLMRLVEIDGLIAVHGRAEAGCPPLCPEKGSSFPLPPLARKSQIPN